MDRISGLMPQIGWSPGLAPVMPEKAPATTVEPVAKHAGTTGGRGAGVDTQTAEDRAIQITALIRGRGTAETASASRAEIAVLARSLSEPDPEGIAGPPPTFDISPLEAKAAELAAPPEPGTEEAPSALASTDSSTTADPVVSTTPTEPPAKTAEAEDRATTTPSGWQTLETAAPGQSLDLLR